MHDLSVVWLRSAAVFYSLGLLHALLAVFQKRSERVFRIALVAFYTGAVLHAVSLVERTFEHGHFPVDDFFETTALCAFLIALVFLAVYWRYEYESLAVFVFPLVFLLTLIGALGHRIGGWPNPQLRDALLKVHVVLVLIGYASLVFTAAVSLLYLIREGQLKRKQAAGSGAFSRLPPLGALDGMMSRSLSIGFVFITAAVVAGSVWASIEVGARWISDPRIGISLATWALYLVIVFLRATAGWRGRKAARLVIALVGCSAITWAAHTGLRAVLSR